MSSKPYGIKFFEVASVSSNSLCGLVWEWNSSWLASSSKSVCVLFIKNESAKDLYASLCMIDKKSLPEAYSPHTISKSMLCPWSQSSPRIELFYKLINCRKALCLFFFFSVELCFVLYIKVELPYNEASPRFLGKFFHPYSATTLAG